MLLGFMIMVSAVLGAITTYRLMQNGAAPVASLPDEMVLFLNLDEGVSELPSRPSFSDPFPAGNLTVHQIITALDKAAFDERVKGVYTRLEGGQYALSHIQELRAAIKRFRASGKFAYVYSPSYGGECGGFGGYYLASSFEQIWMQPMGVISIPGLNVEMPFFRDVLDKVGVQPQFFQRKEYKSAYESLTNTEMSEANREATRALIKDLSTVMARDIAGDRDMRTGAFDALVNKGLFTAEAALAAGLIDKSDYADVLVADIKEEITGEREYGDSLFIPASAYLAHSKRKSKGAEFMDGQAGKPKVALIYAVGTIMPSGAGPSSAVAAADKIAPAIWEVAEDDEFQAIILRIDSPGGSPTASESILRAVQRAQQKGKYVIVSMGPTAASGGYWIAASANQIFAQPTTLTGSIGVVGGKFSIAGLWERLGVKWESVSWGENSSIWSMNQPFSPNEGAQIDAMLDQIYDGFVTRVAQGRNMSRAAVEEVARGRVWSGKAAAERGLVDQLGGLTDATQYTAELLGVEAASNLSVITVPKPKNTLEQFVELLAQQGLVYETARWQSALFAQFKPFMRDAAALGGDDPYMVYEPLRLD